MLDISTVLWKEWRLLFGRGSRRGIVASLLPSLVLFGIILPAQDGDLWVSTLALGFAGWLPILPVMAVVADAFAGERERHTLETLLASPLSEAAILLGKVAAVVGYGCVLTLLILLVGLVTVNFVHAKHELLLYPAAIALGSIVLSLLTATLAASVGVLVSLRAATVKQATQQLIFPSVALTWLPIFGFSLLPPAWQADFLKTLTSADSVQVFCLILLALLALDLSLLLAALARFQRSRLILD